MSQFDRNDGKASWIAFRIASAPTLFFKSDPSDYWLFADLKIMFQVKRFDSSEKVISETEVYFEAKDKSFYKIGIELLEKCWNQYITLRRRLWWWIKLNFS